MTALMRPGDEDAEDSGKEEEPATNVSATMIQVGAGGTCASSVSGSIRWGRILRRLAVRIVLSAVAAASLNLSGILIGSGMPMVGCAAAAFGAFTLGVLTALST